MSESERLDRLCLGCKKRGLHHIGERYDPMIAKNVKLYLCYDPDCGTVFESHEWYGLKGGGWYLYEMRKAREPEEAKTVKVPV